MSRTKASQIVLPSHVLLEVYRGQFETEVVTELTFHETRKWRFDFALPQYKIAIEINGGTFINGRHNRAGSVLKDYEKLNNAQALGWAVFQFTPSEAHMNKSLDLIKKTIKLRSL